MGGPAGTVKGSSSRRRRPNVFARSHDPPGDRAAQRSAGSPKRARTSTSQARRGSRSSRYRGRSPGYKNGTLAGSTSCRGRRRRVVPPSRWRPEASTENRMLRSPVLTGSSPVDGEQLTPTCGCGLLGDFGRSCGQEHRRGTPGASPGVGDAGARWLGSSPVVSSTIAAARVLRPRWRLRELSGMAPTT